MEILKQFSMKGKAFSGNFPLVLDADVCLVDSLYASKNQTQTILFPVEQEITSGITPTPTSTPLMCTCSGLTLPQWIQMTPPWSSYSLDIPDCAGLHLETVTVINLTDSLCDTFDIYKCALSAVHYCAFFKCKPEGWHNESFGLCTPPMTPTPTPGGGVTPTVTVTVTVTPTTPTPTPTPTCDCNGVSFADWVGAHLGSITPTTCCYDDPDPTGAMDIPGTRVIGTAINCSDPSCDPVNYYWCSCCSGQATPCCDDEFETTYIVCDEIDGWKVTFSPC